MKKITKDFLKELTSPLTIIFATVLLLIGASSCKHLVPYTDVLQTKHQWSNAQLENAQFYLSGDICMERELTKEFPDKIAGKIVLRNGVKKEVIFLPKKLPVIFVDTTENGSYVIKCEVGEGNELNFGLNPNEGGKFVLLGSEWKNGYGRVHYNNVEYFVSTDEATTHLLIDLRRHTKEKNNFHVAGGIKVKKN